MGKLDSNVRITTVQPGSRELAAVVRLADQHSDHLGHFPQSCFEREAANAKVLAAINVDGGVNGFVLYRVAAGRAVVQMLCVDLHCRRMGVARALCDELKRRTAHLPCIICHCALEYTESLAAWKSLGFVAMGEKPGRGRSARPLIRLVYTHRHEHLFSGHERQLTENTVVVALDLNVAIDLAEPTPRDEALAALQADWLADEVSFWIVNESHAEALRQGDRAKRQRLQAQLRSYPALPMSEDAVENAAQMLENIMGPRTREQDRSDQLQLAQAIAGGAEVFLTRDERVLRCSPGLQEQGGILVLRPAELLLYMDELARPTDYAPDRLSGTLLTSSRPTAGELGQLVEAFLNNGPGEQLRTFTDRVHALAADPRSARIVVIRTQKGDPLALVGLDLGDQSQARIVVLRVKRGRLAETLTRQCLQQALRESRREARRAVVLADPSPLHDPSRAAEELGFTFGNGVYAKWSAAGLMDRASVVAELNALITPGEAGCDAFRALSTTMTVERCDDAHGRVDKQLWPTILRGSTLPAFVVPVQPRYARDLFDVGLASGSLFGGDLELLLGCENVYYRSSYVPVVRAPSHVLWYVSTDDQDQVQAVRAVSPILSVEPGPARDLYRRHKRLGVYRWRDLMELTGGKPDGEILAIRFGPTECFPNPVPGDVVRPMIARYRSSPGEPPLSMPVEVPRACFEEIVDIGFRKL